MENSTEGPQKFQLKPPYDPAIPLLVIHPKETKTLTQKAIYTPMFTAHYVQWPRHGNNRSVHRQVNG